MTWGLRYLVFTSLRISGEGTAVDDRVERGERDRDLVVGPGMPVFLRILDILERGNRSY